jgi:hypothetical protein
MITIAKFPCVLRIAWPAWAFLAVATGLAARLPAAPNVQLVPGPDRIDVTVDGRPFTSYRYAADQPKPVLYPIHTPRGTDICRGYPPRTDESQDHPHHGGVFFAADRVNGNDFWRSTTRSPRIEHVATGDMAGGDGEAVLSVVLHWIGRDEKVLLEERRRMSFLAEEESYAIDFEAVLQARQAEVVFEDVEEGLFAIRVADWMREPAEGRPGGGRYINAHGAEGADAVWGRRAPWVALQSAAGEGEAGVAILNHPASTNFPTFWHARGYGLFSANPLGQGAFLAQTDAGKAAPLRLTLASGEEAAFRFRVLVYDGAKSREKLEGHFAQYAE